MAKPHCTDQIEPMDLANMRENGVRGARCHLTGRLSASAR
jgi:hypothetical protein